MTRRLTLTQGIGYRGKQGNRAYVAAITGTDQRYGLERTFLDADDVERDKFTSARYTRSYHYDLGPGLYEISEHGERRYLLAWAKDDGIGWKTIDADRVERIARLMADGEEFEAARKATQPAKA